MKIIINALPYKKNSSGIGVMIRDLYGAYTGVTRRKCQIILPQDSPEFPTTGQNEIVRIPWTHRQNFHRIFFQAFAMGRQYCKDAVLLTTDSKCPFFLPKSCMPVPLITDLAVYRMPEVYQWSRVFLWRLQYRYVRRRTDCFLAISEFTKREMVELWHVPPEKIHIVPCASSSVLTREDSPERLLALREKYSLPEQFVLFVGNSNPRKNLARLIQAFDWAKSEGNLPHQLVIAGEQGWRFKREQAVRGVRHKEDIRFIGFVPDEDMPALYTAASLFAFPTLYEGFGIPVIEAQTCGTPVLTSDCSSLPEVGGNGAIYVDPYSVKDIAVGILRVLGNSELAERLVKLGLQNAGRFTWQKSAEKLNKIVEKYVGEHEK